MVMMLRPWLALLGTLLLFSTFEIVSKSIAPVVPPLQINFWRFLVAGIVLLPIALVINWQQGRRLTWIELGRLIRLGIVMVGLSLPLLQWAITFIPASVAAVLFCTNPLFAHLFEALTGKAAMSERTWLGLILSLVGMGLVGGAELTSLSFSPHTATGLGLAVVSAMLFGIYIVMAKGGAEEVGSLTANAIAFLAGAIFTIPFLLWTKTPLFIFNPAAWPQMMYLTFGITCGAYLLMLYALRFLPASTGSLIFFIKPALATILAVWWLGETVTMPMVAGTLVVIVGMFFIQKRTAREGAEQEKI